MTGPRVLRAELPQQADPEIGREVIHISFDDGHTEVLRLHDYEHIYALPGVYEQIVQERLQCRSPQEIAALLGRALDRLGWERARARVIDIAAGNGVSGEALAAEGLTPVLGTDIVPSARAAALRDRPELYASYLTLDLLALGDQERTTVGALAANALSCVAPVGELASQVPPAAFTAAVSLLQPDAVAAYMYDPSSGAPDVVTAERWRAALGTDARVEMLERRRYLHRRTVNGAPYEMEGVVWRVRRPGALG